VGQPYIIGRQISKLAERAKKAPPDARGCGRQISSSRPAFVHAISLQRATQASSRPRSNRCRDLCAAERWHNLLRETPNGDWGGSNVARYLGENRWQGQSISDCLPTAEVDGQAYSKSRRGDDDST
jgi:hypothetical protein